MKYFHLKTGPHVFFLGRLTLAIFSVMGLVSLVTVWCSSGWAHGVLLDSFPKQGDILDHNPDKIVLRFNSSLEPSMTHVFLEDVAKKNVTPLRPAPESSIEQVVLTVPPLRPGVYQVRYRVLATDGHLTEGSVRFTLLSP